MYRLLPVCYIILVAKPVKRWVYMQPTTTDICPSESVFFPLVICSCILRIISIVVCCCCSIIFFRSSISLFRDFIWRWKSYLIVAIFQFFTIRKYDYLTEMHIVKNSIESGFFPLSPRMRVGNNFSRICLCVSLDVSVCCVLSICSDNNFWITIYLGTSILVYGYISWNIKVIGSKSTSNEIFDISLCF